MGVRGPFGAGWPVEAAWAGRNRGGWRDRPGAFAADDLSRLAGIAEDYGRLVILYGARSPRDLLYRKELASWARQPRDSGAGRRSTMAA